MITQHLVRSFISGILIILGMSPLFAQQQAGIEWLTTKEGLSQGYISAILQDREGFLWIGTKNGMNRYDGYGFDVFTHDPYDLHSLSDDYITNLVEYRDFILVGTEVAGLNFFHKRTRQVYRFPNELLAPGFPHDHVTIAHMDVDVEGQVWVQVVIPNLLSRMIKITVPADFWDHPAGRPDWAQRFQVHPFNEGPVGYIGISYDKRVMYLPSKEGFYAVDIHSSQLTPLGIPPLTGEKWINCDPRGNIWITREISEGVNELFRLKAGDPSSCTLVPTPPEFQMIQEVTRDYIWLYSYKWCRLYRLDEAGNFDVDRPVIPPISVSPGHYAALTDRSGLMWHGTNGLGFMKINLRSGKFYNLFGGRSIFGKVFQDQQGNVFTFDNALNYAIHAEPAGSTPPFLSGLGDLFINFGIRQDAAGNYWVAGFLNSTRALLLKKREPTGQWKVFPCPVGPVDDAFVLIKLDEHEHPVIAVKGWLLMFDPATEQFRQFDWRPVLSEVSGPTGLARTPDGSWWIGTQKGLVRAKPAGQGFEYTVFKNDPGARNSLHHNLISSLLTDPADPYVLWIGTKGGGLDRFDVRTLAFKHFTTRNGLPNDVIYGVLNDKKGNLWMSSNKGLIRYTPQTGLIKNYTEEDGIQANEFNTWAFDTGAGGNLLFGGVNGLTIFNPADLPEDTVPPRTVITGLRLNDRNVSWNDSSGILTEGIDFTREITVPFSRNSLTLNFTALSLASPEKNRFRYYLEGAEKEWAHEGLEHTASYLNLAPGTYVFRVEGANSEGVWSTQPAELKIIILPPWYRSWLAWIAYVLLLGGGAYAFYRYQLGRKLEHAENLRLKDMDTFKSRFFTNVTHEFRTPLTVILGMADRLDGLVGSKKESAVGSGQPAAGTSKTSKTADSPLPAANSASNAIALIRRNGQNLLRLINEILDLSKLESNTLKMNYVQGDVLAYLRYISESLHSLANAKNVMLRVESPQAKIEMDYDPERILQIAYNLLSNAVKFTPSGGKVLLRAEGTDHWLHLEVSDTGVGIPPEDLPFIFERFYQAKNQEHNKAGGTGVGLSLTRELVRALGGEISADSEPGKGATFKVKLPVTRNAEPARPDASLHQAVWSAQMPQPVLPLAPEAPRPTDAELPQLLIIEDNPDVVEYLAGCLHGRYQLDFAYNGRAGIEKALDTVPDVIVSDVMMPEKDGFEVCDALKNDERTSHIPIVLLTARATVEDRIAGLRRGADAYLAKPFNPEELLVTLDNLTRLRARLLSRYTDGQPPAPTEDKGLQIEDAFLQKVRAAIETHLSDSDFEMPQLERRMAMSRSQIFRKMKALTGKSPSQFIRSTRLAKARQLLSSSDLTVSEIAYETGFSSLQYFSDVFYEEFGQRPSATRN